MSNELKKAKQKKAALLRATFNARVALERIDYKFDVIDPALEEIENQVSTMGIPEYEVESV